MQKTLPKTCLVLVLTVTASAAAAAADDNSRQLTHDQAAKDATTFISLLESTHADPYTNLGGKVAFKRKAQQLIKDIPAGGLAVGELGDRLSAFIVPLKDGHTRLSGASRERWVDSSPRLAVQFGIASDGMWIEGSDLVELKGARGYKLVAVNGHSVPDMLDLVNAQLSLENIYGSYSGLDLVLHSYKRLKNVLPGLEQASGVTYTLANPQGATIQKTVHWGGEHPEDAERWSDKPVRWSEMTRPKDEFYYLFLDNGRTGYFRVPTMTPRESYEIMKGYHIGDLKGTLVKYYTARKTEMPADINEAIAGIPSLNGPGTQLLEEMKRRNTPNLIVNLRGNGGGSTPVIVPFFYRIWGDAYYGRPAEDESVQVFSPLYLEQRHSSVEEEKKKHPDFELGQYEFTGDREERTAEEKRNRQFQTWKENGLDWSAPLEALGGKPLYRPRKVVILCDPGTFSAAFQAAFIAHQAGAIVVGVPSAQSPNAFMGGTEFVLPESGIKGMVSQGMQMYVPKDPRANIFHPDFEVSYSIFAKYNFDEETILRYALESLSEKL